MFSMKYLKRFESSENFDPNELKIEKNIVMLGED